MKQKGGFGKLIKRLMIPESGDNKKEKTEIHNFSTITSLLNKLKDEIGLDNDQITVIAITSINPEFFTHMLIQQSDFMKWFTTDFSGEGDTEK